MENLINISKTNSYLYEELLDSECVVLKNGKTIHEGYVDDAELNENETGENVVCKFKLKNGKEFVCTLTENKHIDEFVNYVNESGKTLDELLKDSKSYNHLYNMVHYLPVLNLIENYEDEKVSTQYKVLYENYELSK